MTELLTAALKYASYGWHIFPCKIDKSPLTKTGFKEATNDPEQIKKWWSENPNASIGCACGPASGIWILDIDIPDGPANLESLIKDNGPLPETMEQTTGSGGKQFFFNYNGTKIKNSAGKIGKDLDVRGFGGYCLLPPSPHPSGNPYKWKTKKKPVPAPEWLVELVKADYPIPTITQTDKTSLYGKKALADEIINVSCSGEGTRNDTLNRAAYCIGQLVAGGCIDHGQAMNGLLGAAIASGLKEKEARATINSGFRSGASQPRTAPEKDIQYTISGNEQNEQNEQTPYVMSKISTNDDPKAGYEQKMSANDHPSRPNLSGLILEYINNSSGSFTTRDIDHEFGLTTRKEKNARSQALYIHTNKKLIKKDLITNGKYHILKSDLEFIDLNAPAEEQFNLTLPFNIHERVLIPPHSIVILAGSSNAGKSAFILNTLWENRMRSYGKLYLMSEMGTGEYLTRIKKFCTNWKEEWDSVKAASKSCDFNGAIEHHNKDGLTFVDYLEEVEGEYYKIPSTIRGIYDSLGDGVCFIALQKKTDSKHGRGGEGTLEKARLYMSIDHLAVGKESIICALKMVKVKNFIGDNLQGYEMHCRITKGHKMDRLTDWMLSAKVDKDAYQRKYEYEIDIIPEKVSPGDILLILQGGIAKRITEKTARQWQEEFFAVDVFEELRKISYQSKERQFLTDRYIFQVRGALQKKQKEIEERSK